MIKKVLIVAMLLFPTILFAKTCTADEFNAEKSKADLIDFSYKKKNSNEEVPDIIYGNHKEDDLYEISMKNFPVGFYVTLNDSDYRNAPYGEETTDNYIFDSYGKKVTYNIYSESCDKVLRKIYVYLPKYNYFSYLDICKDERKYLKICTNWIEEKDYDYFESVSLQEYYAMMEKYDKSNIFEKSKYFIKDYIILSIILLVVVISFTLFLLYKVVNTLLHIIRSKNEK